MRRRREEYVIDTFRREVEAEVRNRKETKKEACYFYNLYDSNTFLLLNVDIWETHFLLHNAIKKKQAAYSYF